MTIFPKSILLLAIALSAHRAAPAQVTATARADSTRFLLGDQVALHLLVEHSPGTAVQPPRLRFSRDSTVEILEIPKKWDTLARVGRFRLRMDLTFTAWDTGYLYLPALPLAFRRSGEKTDTIFTKEIGLQVAAPPTDSTALADIKPIIEEPASWRDYLPHMGVVLAILIVSFLVWAARRRKRHAPPPPPPVRLLPHELAFQKLDELKREQLWQRGQVKEYHSKLTYIVREYLENRFNISALEKTTDEILAQTRKLNLAENLTEDLRRMLQTVDLVKFAKAEPPVAFHEQAMAYAELFVKTTQMAEPVETEDLKI